MKDPKYGHKLEIEPIDDRRKKMVKTVFHAGAEIKKFIGYEERIRVTSLTQEVAMYMKWREDHPNVENIRTRYEHPFRVKIKAQAKGTVEPYDLVISWDEA